MSKLTPHGVSSFPVVDITPDHHPSKLCEDFSRQTRRVGARAALCVVSFEDGTTWSDNCGMGRRDVLWMLERMRSELMSGK